MKDTANLDLSVIKTFPRSFDQLNDEQRLFLCLADIAELNTSFAPEFQHSLCHWCCIEGGMGREKYQELKRKVIEKYGKNI